MNGNQNQNNMGEQIKDALAEALQSGDFRILNDLVTQTVTDTLNEVGRQITKSVVPPEDISDWKQRADERKKQEKDRRDREEQMRRKQEEFRKQEERRQQEQYRRQEERRQQEEFRRQEERRRQEEFRRQEERRRQEQFRQQSSVNVLAVRKNVGSVSGILFQVFGGIGFGILGLAMLGRMLLSLIGVSGTLVSWGIHLALLAGFAGMIGTGISRRKRLKRADRYTALCGPKMYGDIEKLAEETGRSCNYVRKDIRRMLKAGMFPEGHLDGQKTCFMLNDAVYRQYLEAEENRRIREEEEKKAAALSHASAEGEKKAAASAGASAEEKTAENSTENELNAMVSEGMECIRRLRELNDNIEGEVISDKLSRLENLLKEIFDSVREHPEQMHRMHKPMDYYLPTTLKLVEAYEEFDGISVPGEEVLQAKAEIEKTLDTINEAFAELLNNLFQDAVFDATTDAQVLKSMLAREGLTKEMELSGSGE